jgi:hypothetical protein
MTAIDFSEVSTTQLVWDPVSVKFTVEASSLAWTPGWWADWIRVTNPKTGGWRLFGYEKAEKRDGEVLSCTYVCKTDPHNPIFLCVFND